MTEDTTAQEIANCFLGFSPPYLPPFSGLRVILSVLSLSQQVWKHQGLEGARARGSGVAERVHHAEVPPVSDSAEGAGAQTPRGVQAVNANHGRRQRC